MTPPRAQCWARGRSWGRGFSLWVMLAEEVTAAGKMAVAGGPRLPHPKPE